MKDTENSTASDISSDIRNIIPDDLRLILDSQSGENITGANFLTRTATGEVVTPSGQAPQPGTDLIQIANDFDTKVKSELDAHSFQIPEALLANSLKSEVTNFFPVESLTTTSIDGSLGTAKVFTAANPGESVFGRIWGASLGALQDKLVDADDADNLIEVEPVDAAQLGGLRAWGGKDLILGSAVDDIVNGNAGIDKILGAGGNDLLMGGQDNDFIAGGKGDDLLMGQKGNDELRGGAGNDVIGGGKGTNVLIGDEGNDILIGGGEGDFLIGAEGADHFILRTETLATDAALANRIGDFNPVEGDLIKIAHFDGTLAMPTIRFAAVNVNLDDIQDTAILCLDGSVNRVVGVILGKDSTPLDLNNLQSSIFMVNPKDAALSMIGDHF